MSVDGDHEGGDDGVPILAITCYSAAVSTVPVAGLLYVSTREMLKNSSILLHTLEVFQRLQHQTST